MKSALIAYHSNAQTTWDQNLPWIQLALNTAKHEAHGCTPFELFFSFKPNHPLSLSWSLNELLPDDPSKVVDVLKKAKAKMFQSHERKRERYDATRTQHPFAVNDLVLVKTHPQSKKIKQFMAKLAQRWYGPLRISEFRTPVTAALVDPKTGKFERIAHVSQLKVFHAA